VRHQQPRVGAGTDAHAGGAWLDINAFGLIVGIFNLHAMLGTSPFSCTIPWPDREPSPNDPAVERTTPMCGRLTFQPTEEFSHRFHITNRLDVLVPRYNIAPGQMVPVIMANSPRQFVRMRWGLIPLCPHPVGPLRRKTPQEPP
jgi:hypothetical protein